ncbi:hypothetical protein ACOMHN_001428 [Nucella lapillus]
MNTSEASYVQSSTLYSAEEFDHSTRDYISTFNVSDSRNTTVVSPFVDINAMLWRVVSPLLLALGSFGNVMTVIVMRGMRASRSTACLALYFTALAVSDQCELVTSVMFFWVGKGFSWPPGYFRFDLLCSVPTFVYHVCGITSAWILVAMTYQRVTSVMTPHRVGVLCTVRRGRVVVAVIVLVGIALNIHFLFTWVYLPEYRICTYGCA